MNTLFVGQQVIRLQSTDSTNRFANDLLRSGNVHEGTVVITDIQTSGRGQWGRQWQSDPGKNLTCSVVLFPHFLRADQSFLLNKMTSLAIRDLVRAAIPGEVHIKWPNDIYANGGKISGVLIENVLRNNQVWASVIGVGLNVNQSVFDGLDRAVSLKTENGSFFRLEQVLQDFCTRLESNYLRMKSNLHALDQDYEQGLLGWNTWRKYRVQDGVREFRMDGVSPSGKILMEDRAGIPYKFDFREAEFIL